MTVGLVYEDGAEAQYMFPHSIIRNGPGDRRMNNRWMRENVAIIKADIMHDWREAHLSSFVNVGHGRRVR